MSRPQVSVQPVTAELAARVHPSSWTRRPRRGRLHPGRRRSAPPPRAGSPTRSPARTSGPTSPWPTAGRRVRGAATSPLSGAHRRARACPSTSSTSCPRPARTGSATPLLAAGRRLADSLGCEPDRQQRAGPGPRGQPLLRPARLLARTSCAGSPPSAPCAAGSPARSPAASTRCSAPPVAARPRRPVARAPTAHRRLRRRRPPAPGRPPRRQAPGGVVADQAGDPRGADPRVLLVGDRPPRSDASVPPEGQRRSPSPVTQPDAAARWWVALMSRPTAMPVRTGVQRRADRAQRLGQHDRGPAVQQPVGLGVALPPASGRRPAAGRLEELDAPCGRSSESWFIAC